MSVRDGDTPRSGVIYQGGMLYGTTAGGGSRMCSCGTIFMMNPDTGNETILHRALDRKFGSGAQFSTKLTYVNGKLYGAAFAGGIDGSNGAVFELDPVTRAMRTLYQLPAGPLGASPNSQLVYKDGFLYGTTENGGTHYYGVAFKLNVRTKAWTVLYNFGIGTYNQGISEQNGTLIGSDQNGGGLGEPGCKIGCGVVFSIEPGSGAYTQLAAFGGGKDGQSPNLPLFLDGAFYGSTNVGGKDCGGRTQAGCGIIYKLEPDANGFDERTFYQFQRDDHAKYPNGPLVYHDGAFYGETGSQAGDHGCGDNGGGCGTIFKIDRATHAATILYRFTGGGDGGIPGGGLTYYDGALYGTTQLGANRAHCRPYGCGTVFKLVLAP